PPTAFFLASYTPCPCAFRSPNARFRDCPSHFRTLSRKSLAPRTFSHLRYHGSRKHGELPAQSSFRFFGEKAVIARYTRQEMGQVWSDANKFAKWLEVELAATETLAEAGQVPKDAAAAIRSRAKIDVARIHELESRVKHDVIAFTMAVGESIADPAAARWLHYGMTSNDVVDTAQALQVRDASKLIERGLVMFGEILDVRAHEFRHTPQIGRTHGIHAEPITFGLKIANWFSENQRNIRRFRDAAAQMAVGKISGAPKSAKPKSRSAASSAAVPPCLTSAIPSLANKSAAWRASSVRTCSL